ncbi:hypothetical protein DYB37_003075 [Aphanomyces astaci]|uniref:50S ribosomal protein L9, chloroplastic n=1 Tax=Aphanomyces astaci TaxID=112090 RepID=A0A397B1F9_APHAT|nr:hypothetical protein DYB36_002405 [Aphanomyces astaci]RHY47892.1 hypothetical protein DYB30_002516 [Aphanomyces astaci]RHY56163.1 hypothetical protein DYB34_000464 [Aphanomyces astaci]RHY56209.1 hypothetical protein DYB38_001222 [Aphanomyces astaci]RHZ00803.1 hypothetical protein DYB35_002440 [Aphanomyces astaci]
MYITCMATLIVVLSSLPRHRVDVVLKEDVPKLGFRGDVVAVKAGYARNFLYPEKKAVYATKLNLAAYKVEKTSTLEEGIDAEQERIREQIVKRLSTVTLKFKRHCTTPKPNTKSPVTAQNIVDKLESQLGIKVGIARVILPDPIKLVGNHNVKIRVDDFVDVEFEAAQQAAVAVEGQVAAAPINPDAPVNVSSQTVLQQFATDRYKSNSTQAEAKVAAVVVPEVDSSKRRLATLKVLVERR